MTTAVKFIIRLINELSAKEKIMLSTEYFHHCRQQFSDTIDHTIDSIDSTIDTPTEDQDACYKEEEVDCYVNIGSIIVRGKQTRQNNILGFDVEFINKDGVFK